MFCRDIYMWRRSVLSGCHGITQSNFPEHWEMSSFQIVVVQLESYNCVAVQRLGLDYNSWRFAIEAASCLFYCLGFPPFVISSKLNSVTTPTAVTILQPVCTSIHYRVTHTHTHTHHLLLPLAAQAPHHQCQAIFLSEIHDGKTCQGVQQHNAACAFSCFHLLCSLVCLSPSSSSTVPNPCSSVSLQLSFFWFVFVLWHSQAFLM